VQCRALLDTCSTAHFITERFVEKLSLPTSRCSVPVSAIVGMSTISKGSINLSFHSMHDTFHKSQSFLSVPKISDRIPSEIFPRNLIKIPRNLQLADPQFHLLQPVDMIIGACTTLSILSIGQIPLTSDKCELILQKTRLRWIAADKTKSSRARGSCKLTGLKELFAKFLLLEDATT